MKRIDTIPETKYVLTEYDILMLIVIYNSIKNVFKIIKTLNMTQDLFLKHMLYGTKAIFKRMQRVLEDNDESCKKNIDELIMEFNRSYDPGTDFIVSENTYNYVKNILTQERSAFSILNALDSILLFETYSADTIHQVIAYVFYREPYYDLEDDTLSALLGEDLFSDREYDCVSTQDWYRIDIENQKGFVYQLQYLIYKNISGDKMNENLKARRELLTNKGNVYVAMSSLAFIVLQPFLDSISSWLKNNDWIDNEQKISVSYELILKTYYELKTAYNGNSVLEFLRNSQTNYSFLVPKIIVNKNADASKPEKTANESEATPIHSSNEFGSFSIKSTAFENEVLQIYHAFEDFKQEKDSAKLLLFICDEEDMRKWELHLSKEKLNDVIYAKVNYLSDESVDFYHRNHIFKNILKKAPRNIIKLTNKEE